MLFSFLIKAVIISLSGVMAPGPITAVTVSKGTQQPHSGAMIAIGHGIVELPLMILILIGFGQFLEISWVKILIGVLGGLFLFNMGIGLLKSIRNTQISQVHQQYTPLQAGVVLTIANPYFLIWWATIGAMLITGAYQFGLWGLIAFILFIELRFFWLYFLSSLSLLVVIFSEKGYSKLFLLFVGFFFCFLVGNLYTMQ